MEGIAEGGGGMWGGGIITISVPILPTFRQVGGGGGEGAIITEQQQKEHSPRSLLPINHPPQLFAIYLTFFYF